MADVLIACSGPGAGEAIAESIRIGYIHAAVGGALLFASLALTKFVWRRVAPLALLALLALHPAWTVSAISGDCGSLKQIASWLFTGLGVVTLGWQLARLEPARVGHDTAQQR